MKKILIIAGILIVLVVGVVLVSGRSSQSETGSPVTEEFTEDGFVISDKSSQVKGSYIPDISADQLKIKIFEPSSLADDQSAGSMTYGDREFITANFKTSETREAVKTFYMKQLGSSAITKDFIDTSKTNTIVKSSTSKTTPTVNIYQENGMTFFTIIREVVK